MVSPLADYMPGVRKAVVVDLPRKRLALADHRVLAQRLKAGAMGEALISPRTWKSALAPFLAGITVRTGFLGEVRIALLNDIRLGEKSLPRMIDRCAALVMPNGQSAPADLPHPHLTVPASEVATWRQRVGVANDLRPAVALAPGAVGPSKRWTASGYAELAKRLTAAGVQVWVLGGPDERALAADIAGPDATNARDLTGPDLRNAILALAAADVAVSNDSGLLHVAAAIGTPSVGIFGPTARGTGLRQSAGSCGRDDSRPILPAVSQAHVPRRPSFVHGRHRGERIYALTDEGAGRASRRSVTAAQCNSGDHPRRMSWAARCPTDIRWDCEC
jgi:heptosyltransferase-2